MASLNRSIGSDTSRLQLENQALSEELAQCQADKDFVWSLWKRLQIANPDITQAIGLVIQREKEKAEIKDRKVLEILQIKDDRIEELQNIVRTQSKELSDMIKKKTEIQEDCGKLKAENVIVKDKVFNLELQNQNMEEREKSLNNMHHSVLGSSEKEKQEIQRQLTGLRAELDQVRTEKADTVALRINMESKVKILEREVADKMSRFDGIIAELDEAKKKVRKFESQNRKQGRELDDKSVELETVRKDLSELWVSHSQLTDHSSQQAELIRQLQSLQSDTQKMMRNQEDAYSTESMSIQQMYTELSARFDITKRSEAELRHQVLSHKKDLAEKDEILARLRNKFEAVEALNKSIGTQSSFREDAGDQLQVDPIFDLDYKVKNMQIEIEDLQDRLCDKDRIIEALKRSQDSSFYTLAEGQEVTHSTPARGSHSVALSPMRGSSPKRPASLSRVGSDHHRRLINMEQKLEDARQLLELKNQEVNELQAAHKKRLDRLKLLKKNFRLVKDELKSVEEEHHGPKKKKKLRRSDPSELRRENSDAVWNELAYFKHEHRNLEVESLSQQEEVDALRVQFSHDAATIHELRIMLEQEREDLEYQVELNQKKNNLESNVDLLQAQVDAKVAALSEIKQQLAGIETERDRFAEERRALKTEVVEVNQETDKYRIEIANLRRDLHRFQKQAQASNSREIHQSPKIAVRANHRRRRRDKGNVSKQYQKVLNRSIEEMQKTFDNFNDDDWEEVSETVSDEESPITESDSLGQVIQSVSHEQLSVTDTDTSAVSQLPRYHKKAAENLNIQKKRMQKTRRGKSVKVNPSVVPAAGSTSTDSCDVVRKIVFRDFATSPMHSPVKESQPPKKNSGGNDRQIRPLKQRLVYLQQQLNVLRDSRSNALKTVSELKEENEHLQSDLTLANQRQKMSKQSTQKLSSDLERLQQENHSMETQLALRDDTSSVCSSDKHNEQDWKTLENRLRLTSGEMSRQSATIKGLRSENEHLQEQIKALHDKINRLERDNSQKRILLDDQRLKLKLVQENAKTESNIAEEMETKMKLLTDTVEKNKIQIDSLKKQLAVVTKEKKNYDEMYSKATTDLDKKAKQLSDSNAKKSELEATLSELECTARQQLHGLASHSEAAIDSAHTKLTAAHVQIQCHQQFVKMLSHEIVLHLQQMRSLLNQNKIQKEKVKHKPDASTVKAHTMAKKILNISQSELEEIMSVDMEKEAADADSEADKRKDKKWAKRCERLLTKDDFVLPLVQLFLEKLQEKEELLNQFHVS